MPAISFTIENGSERPEPEWREICDQMFEFLYEITPVDTGVCRDSLEMDYGYTETTFTYPVEYASYLDEGWSKQAPNGMIQPALQYLRTLAS